MIIAFHTPYIFLHVYPAEIKVRVGVEHVAIMVQLQCEPLGTDWRSVQSELTCCGRGRQPSVKV